MYTPNTNVRNTIIEGSSSGGRSDVVFFGVCSVSMIGFVLVLWKLATMKKGRRQEKATPTIYHSIYSVEQSPDNHAHSYGQQPPISLRRKWTIMTHHYSLLNCVSLLNWGSKVIINNEMIASARAHGWGPAYSIELRTHQSFEHIWKSYTDQNKFVFFAVLVR